MMPARFSPRRIAFFVVLAAMALLPAPVWAADVTVDCNGGPADYPSIAAALDALDAFGPHVVTVTGTCHEPVEITDRQNLIISAPSGQTATISPTDGSDAVVARRARNVILHGLVLNSSDQGAGAVIVDLSDVRFSGVIENNPGGGLFVSNSFVQIRDTLIQNNSSGGVFVLNHAEIVFFGVVNIANNGGRGVFVQNQSRADFSSGTSITGHTVNGIVGSAQSVLSGAPTIQNNGCTGNPQCAGVLAARNSTVLFTGGMVSNNQGPGIRAEQLVDVRVNNVTFSNNTGEGVQLLRISVGDFLRANTFSGNAAGSISCDRTSLAVGDLTGVTDIRCAQEKNDKR